MKTKYLLVTSFFLFTFLTINAQKLTTKQLERDANEIELFTSFERDNLQMWFYEKVNQMNLTEKMREEYYSVVLYYAVKMSRLDDKDVGNTEEEVGEKLAKLVTNLNAEVKLLLPKKQYNMHVENFEELLRSVEYKKALLKN